MHAIRMMAVAVLVLVLDAPPGGTSAPVMTTWVRQFGTAGFDDVKGAAVEPGGASYVVGETFGTLSGQTPGGTLDAFVRKYAADGTELWTRQFGAWDRDIAWAVAVDGERFVYVVGQTEGTLPGQQSAGGWDAFVRKYDPSGTEVWTRQFGGKGSDVASGVAVDGVGHVYVVGTTSSSLSGGQPNSFDAFVRRYDGSGQEGWTRQFGTAGGDNARAVAIDAAQRLLVVGSTEGSLPGQVSSAGFDAFVTSLTPDGQQLWLRQFGSRADDFAISVAADPAGNVLVAGSADATLPGQTASGGTTAFLRQFDQAGAPLWTDQFGRGVADHAWDIAVAADGATYLVGTTAGSARETDAFIRKYHGGAEVWTHQFGTAEDDHALAVTIDGEDGIVVGGSTRGTLGARSHGNLDAYAMRLAEPRPR